MMTALNFFIRRVYFKEFFQKRLKKKGSLRVGLQTQELLGEGRGTWTVNIKLKPLAQG